MRRAFGLSKCAAVRRSPHHSPLSLSPYPYPSAPHSLSQSFSLSRSLSTGASASASASPSAARATPVIDFLEVHGGKVAVGALSVAAYLMYTYYLGTDDRRRVEEEAERGSALEPYEMLQLRFANNLHVENARERGSESVADNEKEMEMETLAATDTAVSRREAETASFSFELFREILLEFRDAPIKDSTISYREFVQRRVQPRIRQFRERENAISPTAVGDPTTIQCGYLLDRAVQKKLILHMKQSSGSNDGIEQREQPVPFPDIENVLTIDYLLVLLQQALPQHQYKERANILFEIMQLGENSDVNLEDNINTNTEPSVSRDTILHMIGLLQDSDQLPPEKQPIESGVKHPVKLWRRKLPEDLVASKEVALKLEKKRERWTQKEFFDLLAHYQVCAWGMCYKKNDD